MQISTSNPQTAINTAAIAANTSSITALTARLDNRDQKDSVRAASLTNITLSGAQTIDGVSVIAGDRVGVLGQTTGQDNGIYVCAAGTWTRATDADTSAEVTPGMFFFVEEGTSSADKAYELTTNAPITLGTTVLVFAVFGGGGAASAISNDSSVIGTTVKDALNTLLTTQGTKADARYTQNTQTGTSYTLADADNGKLTTLNNASAIALTVPNTLTVGGVFPLLVLGAGQVTVAGSGGLTVQPPPGLTLKSRGQYARMTVEILSSTLAILSGDVSVN